MVRSGPKPSSRLTRIMCAFSAPVVVLIRTGPGSSASSHRTGLLVDRDDNPLFEPRCPPGSGFLSRPISSAGGSRGFRDTLTRCERPNT